MELGCTVWYQDRPGARKERAVLKGIDSNTGIAEINIENGGIAWAAVDKNGMKYWRQVCVKHGFSKDSFCPVIRERRIKRMRVRKDLK